MTPEREMELNEGFSRARLEHSVKFAIEGLRHLVIINGGAIIGLFTFIGGLGDEAPAGVRLTPGYLWTAFGIFAGGLASAVLANICAYLSQDLFFASESHTLASKIGESRGQPAQGTAPWGRQGEICRGVGIVAAIFSLFMFGLGCAAALKGLLG